MAQKKPFESRLAVMRVRSNYIAPYRKYPFFYLEKKDLKAKKDFMKHIRKIASGWPTGTYYLKIASGQVFARFNVRDGKITLIKESPATGKIYPVWDWF